MVHTYVSTSEHLSVSGHVEHLPTVLCFTDFLLFLSPFIVYSHDTLQTFTYGQDHFSSIIYI